MLLLRVAIERLLLLQFWIARILFILQGIAFTCASVAAFSAAGADASPWLQGAVVKGLLISGTFFVAGVLLVVARRWRGTAGRVERPTWPWRWLLGFSLLVLPAVATLAGSALPSLWRKIAVHLSAVGFWDATTRADPYGGIVLLPIMVALLVPLLLTAAAAFSIAFPPTLLVLVATRSRLVPTLLAMGAICQVALVLNGWIAADVFARLASQALTAMTSSGDAEVLSLASELNWATGTLTRTALALVAPTIGLLAWAAFLRPSGAAAAYFADDDGVGTTDSNIEKGQSHAAPSPWVRVETMAVQPPAARGDVTVPHAMRGGVARAAGIGLALLGVLMALVGAADGLRTRVSYAQSQPAPGATLASGPAIVQVTFAAKLDPGSSLSLIRLGASPAAGDGPRDIAITSRVALDDPEGRTLQGLPARRLSPGLYRVAWWARPAGGGPAQQGTFSFGVNVPVPGDTAADIHSLSERDAGARRRRQTLFGGLLLIGLGVVLPLVAPRR